MTLTNAPASRGSMVELQRLGATAQAIGQLWNARRAGRCLGMRRSPARPRSAAADGPAFKASRQCPHAAFRSLTGPAASAVAVSQALRFGRARENSSSATFRKSSNSLPAGGGRSCLGRTTLGAGSVRSGSGSFQPGEAFSEVSRSRGRAEGLGGGRRSGRGGPSSFRASCAISTGTPSRLSLG